MELSKWEIVSSAFMEEQEKSEFADSNKKVVKRRFSKLDGVKVLDIGCGYGYYTSYFDRIGADVIGIDGSASMIRLANKNYPTCTFIIADITKPFAFNDKKFDIVFCNQVLMDIENIEPIISEVKRVLKDGGIFYFSIVHPAFFDAEWIKDNKGYCFAKRIEKYISNYYFENDFWGKTLHFHRPLSYYFNMLSQYGFVLKHVEEPKSYDGINKNSDLPLFLFAEYQK